MGHFPPHPLDRKGFTRHIRMGPLLEAPPKIPCSATALSNQKWTEILPKPTPNASKIIPTSFQFHPKSSLTAFLSLLRDQKLRTVGAFLILVLFCDPQGVQKCAKMPQKRTKTIQKGCKIGKISFSESHFSMTQFLLRFCSRCSMISMPSWQEKP